MVFPGGAPRWRYVDAGAHRESRKIQKYSDAILALELGHLFRPLVVDCFGRWGKHAVSVMNTCASHCLHGKKFSCSRFFKRHHWRLLSVTIMRALCEQSADFFWMIANLQFGSFFSLRSDWFGFLNLFL